MVFFNSLLTLDRKVRREPRAQRGVKGHNINDVALSRPDGMASDLHIRQFKMIQFSNQVKERRI